MTNLLIKCDKIILPSGLWDGYVLCSDGKIASLSKTRPDSDGIFLDATGSYVSPGFIDIHTHGAGGADFMDGTDGFVTVAETHLKHGTTTLLPTSAACSAGDMLKFVENFKKAKTKTRAYLHGVHLEGPYCSAAQAGALDTSMLKPPDAAEYKNIVERADGAIVRWSIAPELDGALEMGDYLDANGIIPSIAHSDAIYAEVAAALDHHYSLITHLYSATSTITRELGYRRPGVIECAYIFDDLDAEIIADGHHLPAELLRLVYKQKGPDRVALITDSMRAAGMPEGKSVLGGLTDGRDIIVEGGVAKLPDRSAFAGSVATADQLVRVMNKKAGVDIVNSVRMITRTPARILGIQNKKGSIAVNMDCDLVIFDDDINVSEVIAGGVMLR